jgi:hypothetical protein
MHLIAPMALFLLMSGAPRPEAKVPCYAWLSGPKQATDAQLVEKFARLKKKGIDGILYSAGHDPETYRRVGKAVKAAGMEFEAWIPTLVQEPNPKLERAWYAVNGLGQSAFDKPAYVDHYKFLCPAREEVFLFLADLYGRVADVPEVDGVHLDFIRFPDVILARGLWKKYGLARGPRVSAIRLLLLRRVSPSSGEDGHRYPTTGTRHRSRAEAVRQLTHHETGRPTGPVVHAKNKRITAAVFPGPIPSPRRSSGRNGTSDIDASFLMNYNDFYL